MTARSSEDLFLTEELEPGEVPLAGLVAGCGRGCWGETMSELRAGSLGLWKRSDSNNYTQACAALVTSNISMIRLFIFGLKWQKALVKSPPLKIKFYLNLYGTYIHTKFTIN